MAYALLDLATAYQLPVGRLSASNSFMYTVLILIVSYYFPKLYGLERENIKTVRKKVIDRINNVLSKIRRK